MQCWTFSHRCARMTDTRPVELVLRLPRDVADSVEEVQERDPEYLSRVIRYGIVRRAVYRELQRSGESVLPFPHR
jgi:heterodisulfide reductase subunit C